MNSTYRRPSMSDVAQRAGVSYQTVSRVLNNPEIVRADTRARVEEAIQHFGYARNRAARTLKTARSSLIGVLTDGSSHFGPSETTTAIEAAAREADYSILLTTVSPDSEPDSNFAAGLNEFGTDGLLVVAAYETMIPAIQSMASHTPVVAVTSEQIGVDGVATVGVDQYGGAMSVVEHLHEIGARSAVMLAGPSEWFDARTRVKGFLAGLDAYGLDGHATDPGDWSPESGYRLVHELAKSGMPDAIFAANDLMAVGAAHALRELGVSMPEEIALVGFDDLRTSRYLAPPLTTVAQPFAEVGRAAFERLISGLGDARLTPGDAPVSLLATELHKRESTTRFRRAG